MAARLSMTASTEDEWRSVAGPWLRGQAGDAWKDTRPTVVLAPNRAAGFYLRGRLVSENTPFLGIRFWTPSDARKYLLGELALKTTPAAMADLRLLARTCAERLREEMPDDHSIASVARDPAAFLRAYDLLVGAGWDPVQHGAPYGRVLAGAFQREFASKRIATQAGIHRLLLHEAPAEPLLANLLVIGFNALHWPLWDLLKAVVSTAENVSVSLSEPRVFGQDVDQLWIGSWEEFCGVGTTISDPSEGVPAPFAKLAASYRADLPESVAEADLDFCVTPDLTCHIRAVVLRALDYLRRDSCTRLGIVFPEANALALGVAEELRRRKIPLNDGPGVLTPGPFENRSWRSWLALQEEPGAGTLLAWVRACEAQGKSCGIESEVSANTIAKVIDKALGETLVDNLDYLATHLESYSQGKEREVVASFLRRRVVLPDAATFDRFLVLTRRAMTLGGWEEQRAGVEMEPPAWLRESSGMISRRTFLEWLKESTDSQTRTRGTEGNHFYGRVHLLVHGQVAGQTWSHLILAGLNEGVWPRLFDAGAFESRHELAVLNAQARPLNRSARTEGSQGEGHEIVRTGFGHCLLPLQRQELALRDLCAAVECTSHSLCLAAMTTEAGRSLLPSDFFNHAYRAKVGVELDETIFRAMANATDDWCGRHRELFARSPTGPASAIEATLSAHLSRRDPKLPFGPWEFAYAEPPDRPIRFSCKGWDEAWHQPAITWLTEIVGAAPWPDGTLHWQLAVGTWVHRWLASALKECRETGSSSSFLIYVRDAAERERLRGRDRARIAGIELYPWWEHVLAQARTITMTLAEALAPALENRRWFEEMTLPDGLSIIPPGSDDANFELYGRMDLLLIGPGMEGRDPTPRDLTGFDCWVVDFKTGNSKALRKDKLAKGDGLQPLLYALAVQKLGANSTAMSLVSRETKAKEQADLANLPDLAPLFGSLDKMRRGGIFGMRENALNEHGYSPEYPLATRFIDVEILAAKWALVHGGESNEAEEGE